MLYISTLKTANFNIYIVAMDDIITEISYGILRSHDLSENATTIECKHQLEEYFNGTRKEFDLKYWYRGTELEEKVWDTLTTIPYGETITYKQLAEMIGFPNAIQAVRHACNKNMLSILVPCHRVVSISGKPSSYSGGKEAKQILLQIEKASKA